jgi:hypothetical protein
MFQTLLEFETSELILLIEAFIKEKKKFYDILSDENR